MGFSLAHRCTLYALSLNFYGLTVAKITWSFDYDGVSCGDACYHLSVGTAIAAKSYGTALGLVVFQKEYDFPAILVVYRALRDENDRGGTRFLLLFGAEESDVFTDHDAGDGVKKNGAAAHGARREGCVDDATAINRGGPAAGVFEAIHFAVMNDAAFLDALVAAAPDDFTVQHKDGADGYAAFGEAFFGFIDGSLEEWVHCAWILAE